MLETDLSPIHSLPTGLCEDPSGEATRLVWRLAQEDRAALVELHRMWSPALLGIAARILGDERLAESVVEDTFVRLWQTATEYDPHEKPPFVWAFAVMREFCCARLQLSQRPRKLAPKILEIIHLHAPPEKRENPRVMPVEDFQRVRAAMDQLSPDERACLEAAVFLDYRDPETLESADQPAGSVKNCLRQALKKVRNHLSRYEL